MSLFFSELGAWFASFRDPNFVLVTLGVYFSQVLDYFLELFPYVILGCLLGEGLKFTSWTKLIYRFTKRYPALSVISATVLGILSPLCTFGTVPVLITLYGGGVALGPLIAFLAASSMMNPQLFIMTVGGLGWDIALWRLLLVFLFSLLCGYLTLLLPQRFVVRAKLQAEAEADAGAGCGCIENRPKKAFTPKAYGLAVLKNLWFVSRMMLIGIAIAAFVDLLPMNLLFSQVDTGTPLGILVAALAGIPIYACGGGTIPMIASLLADGLSKGSALAFLTVGPATRITSLAAISAIFRKRFLLCYVLFLILFSIIAGTALLAL